MRFYRVGSLHATAAVATRGRDLQPLYLPCPRCGVEYVGTARKRGPEHQLADVWRYPEVADALDIADERLLRECPDHAYAFDV
jgi:hypothetical protein